MHQLGIPLYYICSRESNQDVNMSKRKPKYEYQGNGYPDYQLLFDGITAELEKLYHSLWNRRKESQTYRILAKEVKTAWSLFKLGSYDKISVDITERYTNKHAFIDRKSREIYVNSRNESRFDFLRHNPDDVDYDHIIDSTYDEWLMDLRQAKAKNLFLPYLCRTMMNWRVGNTIYYKGVLIEMNKQLIEIHDFLKYGKTWSNTKESVADLEEALELLVTAQEKIGEKDEKDAWKALFSLIERRYRWWYD